MTSTPSKKLCGQACRRANFSWLVALLTVTAACRLTAGEPSPAERGYKVLRTKQFLPPDFDQSTFDALWKVWPEPLRSQAKNATPAQRRKLTFAHYGLMEPPGDQAGSGPAIGYVSDGNTGWVMSCLACHAGKVAGKMVPGLGNSHYALQTLTEDVRFTKLTQFKKPSHLDLATLKLPLSTTNGTTNSVVFGVVLGALRDADMNVNRKRSPPKLLHHDMDAPRCGT